MFKNKNYMVLIGFVICLLFSITGVYAVTHYASASDLSYSNQSSGLSSTNVQSALDELYSTSSSCPNNYTCTPYKSTIAVGDYVSYTPSVISYSLDKDKIGSGYSQESYIYPRELNLWRVLKINNDGTIDLISEYLSSVRVPFHTPKGFRYYTEYLNLLASQYETSGITVGSRYFGYNGQTEYISTIGYWTCSTGGSCNPVESKGGGDRLYQNDYNLVVSALGTAVTYPKGSASAGIYHTASRNYNYSSGTVTLGLVTINATGSMSVASIASQSSASTSSNNDNLYGNFNTVSAHLRPIIVLKNGLMFGNGAGTKESPLQIIAN